MLNFNYSIGCVPHCFHLPFPWLIGKDPDAGRDWGQVEKGTTEDEMAGWHASPTRWTWVWVNSRTWWWAGRPGMLRFMGLQRVGHNWATELNWMTIKILDIFSCLLAWDCLLAIVYLFIDYLLCPWYVILFSLQIFSIFS